MNPEDLTHADAAQAHDPKTDPPFTGIPTLLRAPYRPDLADVEIALVGVPYDGGSTYQPGARYGPRGVRVASSMIRPFHPVFRFNPHDLSQIADVGDVVFDRMLDPTGAADDITAFFSRFKARGIVPLSCGGDHSIPYPILRGLEANKLALVHIDAHCDTWTEYQGTRFHNGAWLRWCLEEDYIDASRVVQLGIRGQQSTLQNWEYAESLGVRLISIDEVNTLGIDGVIAEARNVIGNSETYISVDIDALDPVFARGTDTPEPGGLTMRELQTFIRGLRTTPIVGADVVEVAPPLDPSGLTAQAAATILYELLCVTSQARTSTDHAPDAT